MRNEKKPVWFVTGCSTGFGREIARKALSLGYNVVLTARSPSDVADLVANHRETALALRLDVTKSHEIAEAVTAAEKTFGHIDVLVNNAGIGYFGAVEESVDDDVRRMFEINFWGLAAVTRAVLPGMRRRKLGFIVNLSSIGGIRSAPGVGYYSATKFAVEGLSEALAAEVAPLGIKVILVEPSGFRTDWAGRSANETTEIIDDYAETAGSRRSQIRAGSGKQPGDPKRAAQAIVDAVKAPNPPFRLLLGKFALTAARKKVEALTSDFDAWASVTEAADFPEE